MENVLEMGKASCSEMKKLLSFTFAQFITVMCNSQQSTVLAADVWHFTLKTSINPPQRCCCFDICELSMHTLKCLLYHHIDTGVSYIPASCLNVSRIPFATGIPYHESCDKKPNG